MVRLFQGVHAVKKREPPLLSRSRCLHRSLGSLALQLLHDCCKRLRVHARLAQADEDGQRLAVQPSVKDGGDVVQGCRKGSRRGVEGGEGGRKRGRKPTGSHGVGE
jgi:hypothetical protein